MTITEFLFARIAEDEGAARAATRAPWKAHTYYPNIPDNEPGADEPCGYGVSGAPSRIVGYDPIELEPADSFDGAVSKTVAMWMDTDPGFRDAGPDAEHIARFDPARVLAECEAKRHVVNEAIDFFQMLESMPEHEGMQWAVGALERTVWSLTFPYSGHPDFDETWRP